MKTHGRYALSLLGFAVKDNVDNGWLVDLKVCFKPDARAESLWTMDDTPVLMGASKTDGLKLEVVPMAVGQPLPAILIPVTLMGDLRVDDDGAAKLTLRMKNSAMNEKGAGFDLIFTSTLCVECTVGDVESLEEQSARAVMGDLKNDAAPLLKPDEPATKPSATTPTAKVKAAAKKRTDAQA